MDLLQKLLPRTKTFEGTVIEVQLVGGFFSDGGRQYNHYPKHDFKDLAEFQKLILNNLMNGDVIENGGR